MGLPKEVRANGGLYIFQNKGQFDTYVSSFKDHGHEGITVLERDHLLAREPGLAGLSSRLVGGLYSAADCVGDCRLFTQRTAEFLTRSNKASFHFGTRVTGVRTSSDTIEALETDRGEIPCGTVILATGVETSDLSRALGFAPNIYPVKGYSGTWKLTDPEHVPALPYVDETEMLAVASYGGRLRVTAIAEFAGRDRSLRHERTAHIADYVRRSFSKGVEFQKAEFWAGLRPSTPAGPPFMGKVRRYSNLWINAGHGQLGWTMALGCGELLAQRMVGEPPALKDVSSAGSWLE